MVKYCLKKYPKGSWKGQQSDGRFMDAWLYQNLELYAEKIVDDMTFLGIIYSSTLEVGTGKSVLATQIGEAWSEIMKKKHGIDVPYSVDNIIWKPKDLIEKAFDFPKYSYVLLDEWEDATYWSELGMTLRQFFRKCRQLNLFIMCIIPNWFQLPLNYAVSRSVFAIDVRFTNKLERGLFAFYNFPAKRILYVAGKRGHNYRAVKPTFMGNFPDGYGVDEKEYRKRKMDDMLEYDREHPERKTKSMIEMEIKVKVMNNLIKNNPGITTAELAKMFNVTTKTITVWKRGGVSELLGTPNNYNTITINKKIIVDENGLLKAEKEKLKENFEEETAPINLIELKNEKKKEYNRNFYN